MNTYTVDIERPRVHPSTTSIIIQHTVSSTRVRWLLSVHFAHLAPGLASCWPGEDLVVEGLELLSLSLQ